MDAGAQVTCACAKSKVESSNDISIGHHEGRQLLIFFYSTYRASLQLKIERTQMAVVFCLLLSYTCKEGRTLTMTLIIGVAWNHVRPH